jgi:hypothetical protein
MEAKTNRVDCSRFSSLGMTGRRSGRALSFARCGGMQQGGWAMRTGELAVILFLGAVSLVGGCGGRLGGAEVGRADTSTGPMADRGTPERDGSMTSSRDSGTSVGPDSANVTDSGMARCMASVSGNHCAFCEDEWYCPANGPYAEVPQCPDGTMMGSACSSPSPPCLTCSGAGVGVIWNCFSTWGPAATGFTCN